MAHVDIFKSPSQTVLYSSGFDESILILVYNFGDDTLKPICQDFGQELDGGVRSGIASTRQQKGKRKKETSWTSAKKRTVKRDKENVGIKENVHVPSLTSAKTTPHGTSISDGIRKQITV